MEEREYGRAVGSSGMKMEERDDLVERYPGRDRGGPDYRSQPGSRQRHSARQCATLIHNTQDELNWASYYAQLALAYLAQGDTAAGDNANDWSATFREEAEAGIALQAKVDC
jgi:hypothetical protein